MAKVSVKRSVKINTGNYENTDLCVEIEDDVRERYGETPEDAIKRLMLIAEGALREKVDDIELGERKDKSKAKRFGL